MVSAPDSTLDVPPAVENDISDIRVDSVGDFTFPERNKFDSGFGITSKTVDYISDVKDDPDWVREFRHKALKVFQDKPMPTHWATKDLENIHFDEFRYYLSDGQKPKRSWDDVPEDLRPPRHP
jgi:Fe-S cluster assembly protein SufB